MRLAMPRALRGTVSDIRHALRRRLSQFPTDSPAGSEHDVVERTLIGPRVVFAADLEARRVGEHAPNLFRARRRVPVPAPTVPGGEFHRKGRPACAWRGRKPERQPARGSDDDDVVIQDPGYLGRLFEA